MIARIPVTEEEIKRYLKRQKRLRLHPPESIEELTKRGVPLHTSGRPLRGKWLKQYYERRQIDK